MGFFVVVVHTYSSGPWGRVHGCRVRRDASQAPGEEVNGLIGVVVDLLWASHRLSRGACPAHEPAFHICPGRAVKIRGGHGKIRINPDCSL